jgi:hypothetical protein
MKKPTKIEYDIEKQLVTYYADGKKITSRVVTNPRLSFRDALALLEGGITDDGTAYMEDL